MSAHDPHLGLARRSFLSRLGMGVTTVGAALGAGVSTAQAQSGEGGHFQPAKHSLDDWLDQLPGKHRFLFDTTTPEGIGQALTFVNNYYTANQNGYGLQSADLAVVVVLRHFSTPFAYNDAIWAKYGVTITQRINFNDPLTKQPAKINIYNSTAHGASLPNRNTTLDSLLKRGVHLAVCQISTRGYAGAISAAAGMSADAIYNELVTNLLSNAHIVPAGIVAVNRAQEHGYSFVSVV
jgi:intracellular sulfur oxidation DsrE/DsrF family protein